MDGWDKHRADKPGKVTKLKYKSFVTSLERANKKTGWVGKKLIVHLPMSVIKGVWMASLINLREFVSQTLSNFYLTSATSANTLPWVSE